MDWGRWSRVAAAATIVGVGAVVSNAATLSQWSTGSEATRTVILAINSLVNSGTVWAGLLIVAGWLVRRPVQAALAGVVAGGLALAVHYGLGQIIGMYEPSIWPENLNWFIITLIAGPVLGLIGAAARRVDVWGLLFRLAIPAAAMVEPFVRGMPAVGAGGVLAVVGALGAAVIVRGWLKPSWRA